MFLNISKYVKHMLNKTYNFSRFYFKVPVFRKVVQKQTWITGVKHT
jgi:hypothetical protein